jgi:hypothetical protein
LVSALNQWLKQYDILIQLFIAIGTVGATVTALLGWWMTRQKWREEERSAGTLTDPLDQGVLFFKNTASVYLYVSIERNTQLIQNPQDEISASDYSDVIQSLQLQNLRERAEWETLQREMLLSPGQRTVIVLHDLAEEATYIALTGLRITTKIATQRRMRGRGRTLYSVYRFAGSKAEEDPTLRAVTHPHKRWVLVFQKWS